MASLWQHPRTVNLIARYRGAEGKTVNRSTGTAVRAEALQIAKGWELEAARERTKSRHDATAAISVSGISDVIARAERMARQGWLNAASARGIVNELLVAAGQPAIEAVTARGWCEQWLASKKGTVSETSHQTYTTRCTRWLDFLGRKAEHTLDLVTKEDAIGFRDALVDEKLWLGTINETVGFLRNVHQAAVDQDFLDRNLFAPLKALKVPKDKAKAARRQAFTAEEVAALVHTAEGDWRGMILLGATTGLRLMDASKLIWKAIDRAKGVIQLTAAKTGEELVLPIHPLFDQWLGEQPRGIGKAPVFPSLHAKVRGGDQGLCPQFQALMQRAGIVAEMAHAGKGKGRNKSTKSYHSLRHFISSQMAMAGVRGDVSRQVTGHADAQTHALYVHADLGALRRAVESLPLSA